MKARELVNSLFTKSIFTQKRLKWFALSCVFIISMSCATRKFDSKIESTSAQASRVHPVYKIGNKNADSFGDTYLDEIQPILNRYCVTCHACTDSPCQLNLTSWQELERGASMLNAYGPPPQVLVHNGVSTRVEEGRPTEFYRLSPQQKQDKEKWWLAWNWDWYQKFKPEAERSSAFADLHYRDFFSVTEKIEGTDQSLLSYLVAKGYSNDPTSNNGFTMAALKPEIDRQEQGKLQCIVNKKEALASYEASFPAQNGKPFVHTGMPYLAHRMDEVSYQKLSTWIAQVKNLPQDQVRPQAAAQAKLDDFSNNARAPIEQWESFLNMSPLKHQLVAKYLYEHLWYAHFEFEEAPGEFFMLVRAKNESGPVGPAERLFADVPSDCPDNHTVNGKCKRVFYRFVKHTNAIVRKTHVVFPTSAKYLDHLKELFFDGPSVTGWESGKEIVYSYNMFEAFKHIPAQSRAQFMIENSRVIFDSVIRGPVCVGRMATYVVDDHFWIWFMDPASDPTVLEWKNIDKAKPGQFDSYYREASAGTAREIVEAADSRVYRTALRKKFDDYFTNANRPFDLGAIWAEKGNPNGWLTVYRHETSTSVHFGANGGKPRSTWVLSYVNFERMYYGISVHFRYYGTATHKLWSWLYFNQHRTEAEDTFLLLMPEAQRLELRKQWNVDRDEEGQVEQFSDVFIGAGRELFSKGKTRYGSASDVLKLLGQKVASTVHSRATEDYIKKFPHAESVPSGSSRQETYDKILTALFEKFQNQGSVAADLAGNFPEDHPIAGVSPQQTVAIQALRSIAHNKSKQVAQFLPNVSYLRVAREKLAGDPVTFEVSNLKDDDQVFSLIVDRGYRFNNVAFSMELSRNPGQDTISVYTGVTGDFPNIFFDVTITELPAFVQALKNLKTVADYEALKAAYAINRSESRFWTFLDFVSKWDYSKDPLRAAIPDMSDYQIPDMPIDPTAAVGKASQSQNF